MDKAYEELFEEAEKAVTTLESTGAFEDSGKSINSLEVDADVPQRLMPMANEWVLNELRKFKYPNKFHSLTGGFMNGAIWISSSKWN